MSNPSWPATNTRSVGDMLNAKVQHDANRMKEYQQAFQNWGILGGPVAGAQMIRNQLSDVGNALTGVPLGLAALLGGKKGVEAAQTYGPTDVLGFPTIAAPPAPQDPQVRGTGPDLAALRPESPATADGSEGAGKAQSLAHLLGDLPGPEQMEFDSSLYDQARSRLTKPEGPQEISTAAKLAQMLGGAAGAAAGGRGFAGETIGRAGAGFASEMAQIRREVDRRREIFNRQMQIYNQSLSSIDVREALGRQDVDRTNMQARMERNRMQFRAMELEYRQNAPIYRISRDGAELYKIDPKTGDVAVTTLAEELRIATLLQAGSRGRLAGNDLEVFGIKQKENQELYGLLKTMETQWMSDPEGFVEMLKDDPIMEKMGWDVNYLMEMINQGAADPETLDTMFQTLARSRAIGMMTAGSEGS